MPAATTRTARTARAAPLKKASAKVAKAPARTAAKPPAATATLTLSSRNYSSWSLRGWLLARFAGLPFTEVMVAADDVDARKELLLLAPSIRVPCLTHEGAKVWNTMAIGAYLDQYFPAAGLLPKERRARAHCLAVCGEMNSGFANLRASLPMNLRGHFARHKVWAGAQPDIDRITEIWRECLAAHGGPFLFGKAPGMADAMFAPVATRFVTYDVKLDAPSAAYCRTIMALPAMQEWIAAALLEPADIEELDMDF